jgi:hypothetical protein
MKRIISISICMVFLLSASTILLALEKVEEPMTFEEFKQEVKRIIKERNAYLFVYFNEKEYDKMPGKLKDYETKLVTHKGVVIKGGGSKNYWIEVGKVMKGTELSFEDPDLKFMELDVGPNPGDNEINYVALEITKFSFKVGKKKHKGWIDPIYRHRVRCIID